MNSRGSPFVKNHRTTMFAAVLAVLTAGTAMSQPVSAPAERSGFREVTGYAALREFVAGLPPSRGIRSDVLATTREGREILAVRISRSASFGQDSSKLRVMLFAQQHGDEPWGKKRSPCCSPIAHGARATTCWRRWTWLSFRR